MPQRKGLSKHLLSLPPSSLSISPMHFKRERIETTFLLLHSCPSILIHSDLERDMLECALPPLLLPFSINPVYFSNNNINPTSPFFHSFVLQYWFSVLQRKRLASISLPSSLFFSFNINPVHFRGKDWDSYPLLHSFVLQYWSTELQRERWTTMSLPFPSF